MSRVSRTAELVSLPTTRGSLTFALVPGFDLTVEIARPPEDVYAYLTDVSNLPQWQSSASSAEADGTLREGARIRERRTFMGREVKTELEVTAHEPGRRFDLRALSGPIRFEVRHSFEAVGNGTRVRLAVEGEADGMLRFAGPMVARRAERQFRDDLQRLKQVLESEP